MKIKYEPNMKMKNFVKLQVQSQIKLKIPIQTLKGKDMDPGLTLL